MQKNKLTIEQQIDHMRDVSGILFEIMSESEAKEFLRNNNYYFKVKAYGKNFEKYQQGALKGKYLNLDFAKLVELSKIDMYFRKLVLRMCLDVEHFLKTQFLRDLSDNEAEDGYQIVEALFKQYSFIESNIQSKKINSATTDLINKYENRFAAWNLVEILSFGDFVKLYELYYKQYPSQNSMVRHLWSVKFLRNAAAHNNCLLNTLRTPYALRITPNIEINRYLSKIPGIKPDSRKKRMKNPVIHDFVVLLYVFNHVVTSEEIKKKTMNDLQQFLYGRVVRNKCYFNKDEILRSQYDFIRIIVDFFAETCV